jgi:8-oxo-dGTP diphosphatase
MTIAERVLRVAAYALCLDDTDRLLLVRIAQGYPAAGNWTVPGGGLEFGEDPADAVLRELEEETGYVGRIDHIAGIDSRHYDPEVSATGRDAHSLRILYRVSIVGGSLRHETDESSDLAAWVDRAAIADLPVVDLVEPAVALAYAGGNDG